MMTSRLGRLAVLSLLAASGCTPRGSPGAPGAPPAAAPAAGGGPAPRLEEMPEGHRKMVALLKEIADRVPDEHKYLGDRLPRELRAQIASLPPGAPLKQQWDLHRRLGNEELRLGENEAAIRELGAAGTLLQQMGNEVTPAEAKMTIFEFAVAWMRLAEARNCVAHHTTESCLLPIQGGGLHGDPEPSRKAIEVLTALLERAPDHIEARWLLNIAWMTLGGWPEKVPERFRIPPETFRSDEDFPRFPDIAPRLGLNLFNLSGGVIADDFDGDGNIDLVISSFDPAGQIRFFRNNADGTFSDRTASSGLLGILGGLNLVQADYDNDGNVDFLVLRGAWLGAAGRHPKSLLRNLGGGKFVDVTFDVGLGDARYPSQTGAWADYDNDGDLDLFIGNESSDALRSPCQLFRNDGGRFTDVAQQAGVEDLRFAKAAVWGDYDGDGFPDLYVSNLAGENRLYHNRRDGTFEDVAPRLGVTGPLKSFPAWFWDFDNDGVLDIFVSSYWPPLRYVAASYLGIPSEAELAKLYKGDGKGGFRDVAAEMNLRRVTLPMGSNFGDLDDDGWLDFYLGTGYPGFEGLMPNVMYRNRGGSGFSDVTTAGGFGHLQKGHAVAFADFDNDGDQDIFIEMGGAFRADKFWSCLFENPGFGHHSLEVRLAGKRSNRSALGARLRAEVVEDGRRRSIYRWVSSGGSFGANPLRQHIGIGKAETVETLEVFWPTTGLTQTLRGVAAGQAIEIGEGEEGYRVLPIRRFSFPR